MFFPNPNDITQAIDAATGDLIWEYRRPVQDDNNDYIPFPSINRNLAIFGNLILDNGADNYAYALDARTGELKWETQILDYRRGAQHSSGPIVANGKVISGRSCEPEGGPEACVLTAFDALTGKELWRTHTIPRPDEPGGDTWGDIPYEQRRHVGLWMVPSFDPELNRIYVGTSVTSPAPKFMLAGNDEQYLYHNSTLAIDADTGKIVWYLQHVVDHWDLVHTAGYSLPKEPGRMARLSLSYVARGSRGVDVLPVAGLGRRGRAVPLGDGAARRPGHPRVQGGGRRSASVLDRIARGRRGDGRGARRGRCGTRSRGGPCRAGPGPRPSWTTTAIVRGVHAALWRAGATADVVSPRVDLSPYRLVLVPALYVTTDETAGRPPVLRGGAAGRWPCGTCPAPRTPTTACGPAATPPGCATCSGYGWRRCTRSCRVRRWRCPPARPRCVWSELVRLDGARVVSKYASGPLAGQPAITAHDSGNGAAWYVSTHLDEDGLDRLVRRLLVDAGAEPSVSTGIELVRRRSATGGWLFAVNHTEADWTVAATGTDLVTGRPVEGFLRLGPGGYAVVREN